MSTQKHDLPRALLGFDAAAVSQLLEQEIEAQAAELRALHEELAAERARQEQIRAEIHRTEEQVRAQQMQALELENALALSGRTAGILQDAVHRQLQILEAEAADRRRHLEAQIAELAERVRQGIRLADQAAEQVGSLAGASSHGPVAHPVVAPTARPEPAPAAGRILPFRTAAQAESLPAPPVPDPAPAPEQAPAPEPAPQVEAGIRNRMAASMSRMLEGKVVGQTLTDGAGAVIAQKGAPITADVAARAESAGVLADLILHMVWPEEAQS